MTYLSQLSVVSPDPCRHLYLPAVYCAVPVFQAGHIPEPPSGL